MRLGKSVERRAGGENRRIVDRKSLRLPPGSLDLGQRGRLFVLGMRVLKIVAINTTCLRIRSEGKAWILNTLGR